MLLNINYNSNLMPSIFRMQSISKHWLRSLAIGALTLALPTPIVAQTLTGDDRSKAEQEALTIINNFTQGQLPVKVECSLAKKQGGLDT